MQTCQQFYPDEYPKWWNFKRHWSEDETSTKKDSRLASFVVKLLNGAFSSCLWKNSCTRCFLLLPFSFFISNITVMCKNKITPSSEFEMTLKELESSHLSSFTVNLTDITKVTAKYCRKTISKYRQKFLFTA